MASFENRTMSVQIIHFNVNFESVTCLTLQSLLCLLRMKRQPHVRFNEACYEAITW